MVCVCYKMVYGLWFGGVCLGFGAVIWNLWCDCCVWLVVIRFGVWVTFPVGLLVRRLCWLTLWVCVLV